MQVVSHLRFDSLHLPPVVIASPIWLIGNHFPQARRRRAAPPQNKTSSEEVLRTRWPAKLDLRCPLFASRFPRSNLPASSLHQPWDSSLRFSRFLRFLRQFFSPRGFLTPKRRTGKPHPPQKPHSRRVREPTIDSLEEVLCTRSLSSGFGFRPSLPTACRSDRWQAGSLRQACRRVPCRPLPVLSNPAGGPRGR